VARADPAPGFAGVHQPGILTPPPPALVLAAFDLTGTDLEALLAAWSATAERLTGGGLTLTFGLGPALFDRPGLRDRRPVALRPLPPFPGDELDLAQCDGDLCVQACAPTAEVAADAVAALTGAVAGAVSPRWRWTGFLPARGPTAASPRDLLGFRDGSANPRMTADIDRLVWAGPGDRSWMRGGTYLVARRIRLDLAAWARVPVDRQERIIGRHKGSGAPLGRRREYDPREPVALPADAHARLAAPEHNQGVRMLRRGYGYDDGNEAGLIFLAFARDPRRQYVPVQRRLAEGDALNEFATHTGSAVFALPPGARPGGSLAEGLF
jgi:deferrochelatase/peroxidase EfeB